jgi:hypothetical protein
LLELFGSSKKAITFAAAFGARSLEDRVMVALSYWGYSKEVAAGLGQKIR